MTAPVLLLYDSPCSTLVAVTTVGAMVFWTVFEQVSTTGGDLRTHGDRARRCSDVVVRILPRYYPTYYCVGRVTLLITVRLF